MLWLSLMAPNLSSSLHHSFLPHSFLYPYPQRPPPLHFPSTSKPRPSLSSFNRSNLTLCSSTAQSLENPLTSPLNQQPLLSFDAQIVYDNCFDLLNLSVRYGDVQLTRAVHSLVFKLDDDTYLLNSLLSAYLHLGFLSDAYNVFVSITAPDVVSYTAIVSGFAKSGYEFQAIELFCRMRDGNIDPNEFTFVALLTACSRIRDLNLGFQLHSLVVKLGFVYSTYVSNALMGLYTKTGCLDDALQVFDEMSERDIASWNTVISGHIIGFEYGKAFELFSDMQRVHGFRVNQFTLSSLISACTECSAGILGREIHAYVLKCGFQNHLSVGNALIGFYAKCGSAKEVQAVFERMPIKNVISWTGVITAYMELGMVSLAMDMFANMPKRNVVSFNAVLTGLCRNGEGIEALSLFNKMVNEGMELTEHTLTSIIGACCLLEEKNVSEQVHAFVVKFGYRSNAFIEAALLDMCARCARMTDAQKIYHRSQHTRNLPRNWTALTSGFARNGQLDEAMSLFQWGVWEEDLAVDEIITTTMLGICGRLGFYELGEQMHSHAVKSGFSLAAGLGNALISMYSKCDNMDNAVRVFNTLPVHDVVSWNSLITGHLLQRQGDEGLEVWSRMKRAFMRPDAVTFVLVISCYRHTTLNMLDDCRKLFSSMKSVYDIEPTSDHYVSIVSVLCNWGCLEEAEELIAKMPFEPKASVWRALLHGCQIQSDSTAGKRIAKHFLAMEPQDPSTYILISNLLSASGRWHCSEMVREEMRKKGLRKHPARCWTIHQSKIHSFYTRDKSHSQTKDIYSGLDILILECLKAGYVPNTKYVLHEVEEHQKTDFLFYHSAKLAVTYGLLATKTGRPIRVTKNVLLCGDCHNFFKYVSEVTRREIRVRDTSGFHHFSDGRCSCNDL